MALGTRHDDLWYSSPVQVFEQIRDAASEAIDISAALIELAQQYRDQDPHTRLSAICRNHKTVGGEDYSDILSDAIRRGQFLFDNTPIKRFLDQYRMPVSMETLRPDGKGRSTASSYHDLAFGVACQLSESIARDLSVADYLNPLRFLTAAGDWIPDHVASIKSYVACECTEAIKTWKRENEIGEGKGAACEAAVSGLFADCNTVLNELRAINPEVVWKGPLGEGPYRQVNAWLEELDYAVSKIDATGQPQSPKLDELNVMGMSTKRGIALATAYVQKLRSWAANAKPRKPLRPEEPAAPTNSLDDLLQEFQNAEKALRTNPDCKNSLGIACAVWRNYPKRMWEIDSTARKTGPRMGDFLGRPIDWTEDNRRKAVGALNIFHVRATAVLVECSKLFRHDPGPIGISSAYCAQIFREGRVPDNIPLSEDSLWWPDLLEVLKDSRSDAAYTASLAARNTIQLLRDKASGGGFERLVPPPKAEEPGPPAGGSVGAVETPAVHSVKPSALKEPSQDAFAAYRAQRVTGKPQTEIAEILTAELKRPISQGQVSRWINEVVPWMEAGNVLPDLPGLKSKPTPMAPDKIDLGGRQDGRTKRQREDFEG